MTDKKTAKLPNMTRNYSVVPETIDVENRKVEVVWTSGARALQFNYELGEYLEELEVSTQAINMERLASGSAPFLNMHDGYSLSSILGVVEKAWIDEDKGEGRAVIRFPKDDPEIDRVWNLVAQGILRNISVGYTVEAYEKYEEAGKFIYRAVKWTPLELSAVTVPADAKATVRASEQRTSDCVIISTRSTSTTTKEKIMNRSNREDDEIKDDELENESLSHLVFLFCLIKINDNAATHNLTQARRGLVNSQTKRIIKHVGVAVGSFNVCMTQSLFNHNLRTGSHSQEGSKAVSQVVHSEVLQTGSRPDIVPVVAFVLQRLPLYMAVKNIIADKAVFLLIGFNPGQNLQRLVAELNILWPVGFAVRQS